MTTETTVAVTPVAVTLEEMAAQLAALRAENAKLKSVKTKGLNIKVSQKGAVSVYGLGRFPVTLYAAQFRRLLAQAQTIETFIEENKASLNFKPEVAAE